MAQSTSVPTPEMGYNTYNAYACSPSDAISRQTMDLMISKGFRDVGYKFFQVDCGWVAKTDQRDANGALQVDSSSFPNGMQAISQYAKSKGLDFGLYSDAGYKMCDTDVPSQRLGSLGHEDADAKLLASFNVTHFKYDNCYADGASSSQNAPKNARTDFPTRFTAMKNALDKVGITRLLICQWGVPYSSSSSGLQGPSVWTKGISTSYRLSDDIAQGWDNVYRILNQAIPIAQNGQTGPGHWADGDLLEVGNNGMTLAEQATHFAFWAMVKSPLVVSTDLSKISSDALAILLNRNLISINQDSLGKPVVLVERRSGDYDLHAGPLANGDVAVLAFDLANVAKTITIRFADLGIESADVLDLWSGTSQSGVSSYAKSVGAHGSSALRLSNIKYAATSAPSLTYIEAEAATLAGGATKASCSGCSGGSNVGYVGKGGTLTFTNVRVKSSEAVIYFDYINADVGFSFVGATNDRTASISVNGATATTVSFPLTGYNWDKDVTKRYKVRLTGFNPNAANTITISNANNYAPNFDRIGF
ncbi:glycoside hydrolase [Testicularia cyperi]|uniref:Alpha-galactosidase n=1 Tax=Testicularia cyperi TaxID=1882483 RepID=A0A317XGK7_9BASI|nr:glycoside hydrolase [Testicularia cyperi]